MATENVIADLATERELLRHAIMDADPWAAVPEDHLQDGTHRRYLAAVHRLRAKGAHVSISEVASELMIEGIRRVDVELSCEIADPYALRLPLGPVRDRLASLAAAAAVRRQPVDRLARLERGDLSAIDE
jgi:hypothetical protein